MFLQYMYSDVNFKEIILKQAKTLVDYDKRHNDCDVISGLIDSQKTDFSDIFLLWAKKFAKKQYRSALFRK